MVIRKLIEELQEIAEVHGDDLGVRVRYYKGSGDWGYSDGPMTEVRDLNEYNYGIEKPGKYLVIDHD